VTRRKDKRDPVERALEELVAALGGSLDAGKHLEHSVRLGDVVAEFRIDLRWALGKDSASYATAALAKLERDQYADCCHHRVRDRSPWRSLTSKTTSCGAPVIGVVVHESLPWRTDMGPAQLRFTFGCRSHLDRFESKNPPLAVVQLNRDALSAMRKRRTARIEKEYREQREAESAEQRRQGAK
jgi:hypothetical protein